MGPAWAGESHVSFPRGKATTTASTRSSSAKGPHVEHDPRTNALFTASLTPDGGAELVAETPDVIMRKTVFPDGRVAIEVAKGKETLTVTATGEAIAVALGKKTIRLHLRTATERDLAQARALLAGSRALRAFRAFGAALESGDEEKDSMSMTSTLVSGALLNFLDGDPGALARVSKRVEKKHLKQLRQASRAIGCYPEYEQEVYSAWTDLMSCYEAVSIFLHRGCEYRWFLWIESAWFSFIRCSAFSW
jgi:hypothetical protein